MFRSLRSRLLALLTGIVVLAVSAIGIASGELIRESTAQTMRDELARQARVLAGAPADELPGLALQLERLTGSEVFVVSDGPLEEMPEVEVFDPESTPPVEPGEDVQEVREIEWQQRGGERMLGYALSSGDTTIVVARPIADLGRLWEPLALQITTVLVSALIAAWVVALALSHRITRPLRQLVSATNDIARGRYPSTSLEGLDSEDEIGQLAGAFRDMAVKLREVDSRDRRFLMSISHELRTPLTAITGHAQALEDGLADDPAMRERSLAVIRREAGRLDRLVEDIIDLARLRSNRFNTVSETVQLCELGEHLLAIFEDRAAHPEVRVRGDFEDVAFHSDGQRILQILRNLVNNGLRYARTEVAVDGRRVGGHIQIRVRNDGEPVSEEMQERIFEPFVGSKREGGMGLGLAIGRELAWALGGNLRYVPTERDAVFELSLPLEPPGSGR